MKLVSPKFCVVIASTALLLAGCSHKPTRPNPTETTPMGPTPGATDPNLRPTEVPTTLDNSTLQPRLPDGVIDDGNTIRGLLQPVYFDFDAFSIKQGERDKLKAAKEYLDKNPTQRLLVEGHCDWRGTAEYNLGLGDRRANSAKKYLISLGVASDKVEIVSKGSLEAKANADDATMAKDRRADLVIIKAK